MGIRVVDEPCLVWDNDANLMVRKVRMILLVIGNRGSVMDKVGPIYIDPNKRDLVEAERTLRSKLEQKILGALR